MGVIDSRLAWIQKSWILIYTTGLNEDCMKRERATQLVNQRKVK